jgi:hypothetical protein
MSSRRPAAERCDTTTRSDSAPQLLTPRKEQPQVLDLQSEGLNGLPNLSIKPDRSCRFLRVLPLRRHLTVVLASVLIEHKPRSIRASLVPLRPACWAATPGNRCEGGQCLDQLHQTGSRRQRRSVRRGSKGVLAVTGRFLARSRVANRSGGGDCFASASSAWLSRTSRCCS